MVESKHRPELEAECANVKASSAIKNYCCNVTSPQHRQENVDVYFGFKLIILSVTGFLTT